MTVSRIPSGHYGTGRKACERTIVAAACGGGSVVADIDGLRCGWLRTRRSTLAYRNHARHAYGSCPVDTATLLNRALHADRLEPPRARPALLQQALVLLNCEAVESGLRVARSDGEPTSTARPAGRRIIWQHSNFHGHTSSVVGFSSDPALRAAAINTGLRLGTVAACCGRQTVDISLPSLT